LHGTASAFVTMDTPEDAKDAAKTLNKTLCFGFTIACRVVGKSKTELSNLKTNRILITGLKCNVNEQDILTHIQKKAKIGSPPTSMFLSQHPKELKYPGFITVELKSQDDAKQCVKKLCGSKLKGKKIWCRLIPMKEPNDRFKHLKGKTSLVLISNVHHSVTEEQLKEKCDKLTKEKLISIDFWHDKSGYRTGCVLVTTSSNEDATKLFVGVNREKMANLKLRTSYHVHDKKNRSRRSSRKVKKKVLSKADLKKKLHPRHDGVRAGYHNKNRQSNASTGLSRARARGNRGPKLA